jgi:uncharacterized protein (TIGR00661 family)
VRVTRIPGLRFAYDGAGTLDYFATAAGSLRYFQALPALVDLLSREMEKDRPALAITDFEPAMPFAARRMGVPLVCFDHQHFLTSYDLSELPPGLRVKAGLMAPFVRLYCRAPVRTIVSSFYDAPLRAGAEDTVRVGVLLRPEVLRALPTDEGHLIAYLRRDPPKNVMEALAACGRRVKVYGPGRDERVGDLEFRPTGNEEFVADLAAATALVATAGNQLLGEALYLGKPILAFPEPGNFEQQINGFFLPRTGGGESYAAERFRPTLVRRFLDRLDWYRDAVEPGAVAGNVPAAAAIRQLLRRPVRELRRHRALRPVPVSAA